MKLGAFILAALMCGSASAQVVFGQYDCGQWVAGRPPARAWLLGFLSGVNFITAKPGYDPLDKVSSAEQIYLWMDNYCKANPLNKVTDGAADLYLELQMRK